MATLEELLLNLPDVGRTRLDYFAPDFWVKRANMLLGVIERNVQGPLMYAEAFIPLQDKTTMYLIPANLRKVRRVRSPIFPGGIDTSHDLNRVGCSIVGNFLRLDTPASVVPGRSATLNPARLSDSDHWDRIWLFGTSEDSDVPISEGWYARLTYTTREEGVPDWPEYRRVIGLVDSDSGDASIQHYLQLDGPFVGQRPGVTDKILVTDQFIMLEGSRHLPRFVSKDSLSPLPEEWNDILVTGLRYHLEIQSDEEGGDAAASVWYSQFMKSLEEFQGDAAERPGDMAPIAPRRSVAWDDFASRRRR